MPYAYKLMFIVLDASHMCQQAVPEDSIIIAANLAAKVDVKHGMT